MPLLRPIEIRDIPDLFRVRVATDENRLSMAELAALGISEASVAAKLGSTHRGWVADIDGQVVGFAIGDRSSGELWVIAVLPAYTRQGIGSALLRRVEDWLFSEGRRELWLTTDVDPRLRAYSFYRKHGWSDWKIAAGLRYMKHARANPPGSPPATNGLPATGRGAQGGVSPV